MTVIKKARAHHPRDIVIRPAVRADAKVLAQLVHELHAEQNAHTVKFSQATAKRDVLADGAPVQALIAELDGSVVAFAFFIPAYDSARGAAGLSITDFYVTNAGRAKSVGHPMLAGCAAFARQQNARFLWWTSKAWDVVAHDLYRKLGVTEEPVMAHHLSGEKFNTLANEGAAFLR